MGNRFKRVLQRTTLDLDKIDKEMLRHHLARINTCPHILKVYVKLSSLKGYHVQLFCSRLCQTCRLVFDDTTRFNADLYNRFPYERNILWQNKTPRGDLREFIKKRSKELEN